MTSLRPKGIDSFVGQAETIGKLRIVLDSAKKRNTVPGHILLSGPPGLGKTSLAAIVAEETGLHFQTIVGAALATPADVITALTGMKRSQVLFIDEIHGVGAQAEETLYSAMEDGVIHIATGSGANVSYVTLPVPEFVLVGATTAVGRLSKPLIDRFETKAALRLYTVPELTAIAESSAKKLGVDLEPGAAELVAERANGTPRIVNSLLSHVRDVSVSEGAPADVVLSERAMDMFGIDGYGLDSAARHVLSVLDGQFDGGPVGGAMLARACGEKIDTLENVIEPLLMKYGLMKRSPRGRMLTDAGRDHIKATDD